MGSNCESKSFDLYDGLVAYYDFSTIEVENKIIDASGRNNDGILCLEGEIIAEEDNDSFLRLKGSGYVKLPDDVLKGIEEITVACWVRFHTFNGALPEWQRVFDFGIDEKNYFFLSKNRKTRILIDDYSEETLGSDLEPDEKWIHVAVTVKGDTMTYYENGKVVSVRSGLTNRIGFLSEGKENYIGKSKFSVDPNLNGDIDDFLIYEKSLSDWQVKNLMLKTITDKGSVALVKKSLAIDSCNEIVSDIELPRTTYLDVDISWRSSDHTLVSNDGKINRPKEEIRKAILTAELIKGEVRETVDFEITVLPEKITNYKLEVAVKEELFPISPMLIGAFYEDINHSADGGLYAELIENNSFEYKDQLHGWKVRSLCGESKVKVCVDNSVPLNEKNRNYLRIEFIENGQKIEILNNGYRGITLKENSLYDLSLWSYSSDFIGEVSVYLEDENENKITEVVAVKLDGKEWGKYQYEVAAKASTKKGKLIISAKGKGVLNLDMISLLPQETWMGRKNGLRKDLVKILADYKPKFLRFPGGCIVEGNSYDNMYNWKDTIGKIEERKTNTNLWGYHQSYGLGFYEYFQLAEDIGAVPVPVVNVGMVCQIRTNLTIPVDDLESYIQDALDLIEYANGPEFSIWGRKRVEAGHPEPFNLRYLAIGNEQWGPEYFERYTRFKNVLKATHPEIQLITSSGPFASGEYYDEAWEWIKESCTDDIVDEHYYMSPEWFIANRNRYDSFDRNGAKIFVGEYAARSNTLKSALSEAVFLTGLERNSDVVAMASYAPLFAKTDDFQWAPDMIWFDGDKVYGTPNYYVQKLFSTNLGSLYIKSLLKKFNDKDLEGRFGEVFSSTSKDEEGNLIIKLVNTSGSSKFVNIELKDIEVLNTIGSIQTVKGTSLDDVNSLDNPENIAILEESFGINSTRFSLELSKYSINSLKFKI
ncbi:alpha-L-arabinofuranosidase C-terminal domain-containing protein [Clostridium sp. C8-1-8]|uniref:alpha-L-arabinofuranosidase C-terminal domain-containing protein n=1 Tax=Clostridium sp. C8-1-8 TaxID=2698831 RepID=UPI00136C8453|nr:alpha-L-arabinofuranosidase C-terminal domain-containing protein [Clostridium sp. C8-1-8]